MEQIIMLSSGVLGVVILFIVAYIIVRFNEKSFNKF